MIPAPASLQIYDAVSFSGSASARPVIPLQSQGAQSHVSSGHFYKRINREVQEGFLRAFNLQI